MSDPQPDIDKKAKAKAKNKERKRILNEMDYKRKKELATMGAPEIADYITQLITKSKPELSAIEIQDGIVSESQIISTAEYNKPRELQNYADFFTHFRLSEKGKGKDLVLVLCMSAIKVCDIVRQLRSKEVGGALKLIKQNKIDYDRRCLRSPCHVAVSTPGRIEKLRTLKLFDTKRVSRVVVDSSTIDVKQRNVWDIDGTIDLVAELSKRAKVYLF